MNLLNIDLFKKKKIAVLGCGVEGVSAVNYLTKKGIRNITVFDEKKSVKQMENELKGVKKEVYKCIFGPVKNITQYNLIIASPSVKLNRHSIVSAKKSGAIITTAINIFMKLAPCPIIGITGTKGKGTTSALIYEILKKAKHDVYLGGNIGTTPLDFLDKLTPQSIAVLELSSFQIMNMERSPHVAVILMITCEHLDFHENEEEYIASKAKLIKFQKQSDWTIYNIDYPNTRSIGEMSINQKLMISTKKTVNQGVYVNNRSIFYKNEEIISTGDMFIPGRHNWENVCAAIATAKTLNIPNNIITDTVKNFRGLPHRLELARAVKGVSYYNDSFSTTPETAIAAINAFDEPKIVILGGSPKGSDFSKLGRVVSKSKSIRGIVGIGVEWKKIIKAIRDQGSDLPTGQAGVKMIENCQSMKEIVEAAKNIAQKGDVVLLSPACASFDMFENYKDRGEQFKKCVYAL